VKALLVTLVVLLGLLVVADRVAVNVAEDRVAQQVQSSGRLAGPPTVDIGGFPFLTQAVAGDYSDVRLQLSADDLAQPGLACLPAPACRPSRASWTKRSPAESTRS
jgi:hypothetical protein